MKQQTEPTAEELSKAIEEARLSGEKQHRIRLAAAREAAKEKNKS
jgi:hypothetical protein